MVALSSRVLSTRQRLWYAHIGIIVAAEFSAEAARGLVLPTLFSYAQHLGGDLVFMGLLTALFSAGRFVSSLLLGVLSDRVSFKTLYHLSAAIAVIGNVLHVLPYSPHVHSKTLLGVSRFVIGFGAGNRSVCRADIAALTRVDQRTSYFTLLATVVFLAYALTPGLGGIFADIDFLIGGSEYLHFNEFTAPGFVLVVLNLTTMAVNALVYDGSVTRADAPGQNVHRKQPQDPQPTASTLPASANRTVGVATATFIFVNVIARGILSIFETVNVPLYLKMLNQTSSPASRVFDPLLVAQLSTLTSMRVSGSSDATTQASRFFLTIGLLGLVSYGAVHWLGGKRGRINDLSLMLFGLASLFAGNAGLFLVSTWISAGSRAHTTMFAIFFVAEVLVWSVGCPITSTVIVTAFSKALGTRPQGKLMGVFGASASISRMVLPFLPGVLPSWEILFLVNMALSLGSVIVLVVYMDFTSRQLRRPKVRSPQLEKSPQFWRSPIADYA